MPKDEEPIDPGAVGGEGPPLETPLIDPDRVGLVAWNNVIDSGFVDSQFAGTQLTPVTNVQDRRLAKSWRCTPPSSLRLKCTLAKPSTIRLVAVNVISPRISQIGGDGAVTAILINGVGGFIATLSIAPIPVQGDGEFFPTWLFFDFEQHYENVASIFVDFVGGWNTGPGGVVEIGRFWASYGLSVPGGFDAGWSQSVTSPNAKKKESRGGQAYVRPALPQRTTAFAGTGIDVEDVILSDDPVWRPTVQQLAMQTSAFEECIALIRTDSSANMQALGVYGSVSEPITWQHEGADYYSVNFKHTEER